MQLTIITSCVLGAVRGIRNIVRVLALLVTSPAVIGSADAQEHRQSSQERRNARPSGEDPAAVFRFPLHSPRTVITIPASAFHS